MDIAKEFKELVAEIEAAGNLAHDYFTSGEAANEVKSDGSVVTEIDNNIEMQLRAYIDSHFPEDQIVGEEGEGKAGASGFVWHIDPIDGTDNFLRRIPFTAVSVARLGETAEDSFAVVHNPITKQTFASLMEDGVYEQQLVHDLNDNVLGGRMVIAVARGKESWMKPASLKIQQAITMQLGKSQPFGCCALELAYVASNRIDGVLSFGLNTYDYAAGLFLVKAGGGTISVCEDGVWTEWTGTMKEFCTKPTRMFFASHAGVHKEVLALVGDPKGWVMD